MTIQLKPMKLFVTKINNTQYQRTITDMEGTLIWDGGLQYYMRDGMILMTPDRIQELIIQMQQLPSWNIVEVFNEFTE